MTPPTADRGRCSGCNAEILWAYTEAGKRMPLDAAPLPWDKVTPGAYWLDGHRCHAAAPMFDPPGLTYHMNHWATCPQAEHFRAKTPKRKAME